MRAICMAAFAVLLGAGAVGASPASPAVAQQPATTTLGIMVPRVVNGTVPYTPAQVLAEADAVGVDTLRIGQKVTEPPNGYVRAFEAASKRLVLDVKAGDWPKTPPSTPSELAAYEADLDALLDHVDPALLAVENEETVDMFVTGTPDQYLAELRSATKVGHENGALVTNGGLPFEIITLVVWNHLRKTEGTTAADRFLGTVADTPTRDLDRNVEQLRGTPANDPDPYSRIRSATQRQAWKDAEYLLSQYGTDPGDVPIDYVNFHWYATDEEGFQTIGAYTDADGLRDAVAALEEITGKPLVNNEIGQWGETTAAPAAFLQVLVAEERLPFVVWFDADGLPATALHDFDPSRPVAGALRPNGREFSRWIHANPVVVSGELAEQRLAYVEAGYQDALARPSDTGGRLHWAVTVGTPAGRRAFGSGLVRSREHDARSVEAAYASGLGRSPDEAGHAYWTDWLATNDLEDLQAILLASPEHFTRAGSTPRGYVTSVYATVLGRTPDPSGQAYWEAQAATDSGRRRMATAFVRCGERRGDVVQGEYRRLLDRDADPAGLAHWTGVLGPPSGSVDDLLASIIASEEYRRHAA